MEQLLVGKVFAWCHGGRAKTGEISFEAGGKTGVQAPLWKLPRWRVTGDLEVTLESHSGRNAHRLYFNSALTGFYCNQGAQRGYVEGRGFTSPDMAGAPTSAPYPVDDLQSADSPQEPQSPQSSVQQQQWSQQQQQQQQQQDAESQEEIRRSRMLQVDPMGKVTINEDAASAKDADQSPEEVAQMLDKIHRRIMSKRMGQDVEE